MRSEEAHPRSSRAGTGTLIVLSAAMFVYVIDTTLMNVSISALVDDLDTTVRAVQSAITLYTLTMASFMLTGGKLGDIWGSKRAFRIGLVVYGVGTTLTAMAPGIGFVIVGWSILEGLGSALIVPAINTLVRANFAGARRAAAYGVLFGVAAAGAAFGPLIGGWVTASLSWRVAFAGEALIVVIVLASAGRLDDAPPVVPTPRLDVVGVVLSVAGLGVLVLGILQTASRGWTDPLVVGMVVAGLVLLGVFVSWVRRREAAGKSALLKPSIFRHRSIVAGLPVLSTQTFAQAGLLFLIPLYAQSVLGFDAFETGVALLPLSIGVLATSMSTPRLGAVVYPKWIVMGGLVLLFVGGFILAGSIDGADSGADLAVGLLVGGLAIGLVAGQLPNMVLSGADAGEASEASGLQGTAQNLGMAMGTAVIGTVILSVGLSSFGTLTAASTVLPDDRKDAIEAALEQGLDTANRERITERLSAEAPEIQDEVQAIYEESIVDGFQAAILAGGVVALLGAVIAMRLPSQKLERDGPEATVRDTVRNPTLPALQLEMEDLPHEG